MISFAPGKCYDIAVTNVSSTAAAAATNTSARRVRLITTIACYVSFSGAAAVAGSASFPMTPNFPEVFRIAAGQTVNVIGTTTTGTLSVSEE